MISKDRGERLAICKSCPFLAKDNKTCTCCGCYVKPKVMLTFSSCPKQLWPGEKLYESQRADITDPGS
jgi:hypothetical protein